MASIRPLPRILLTLMTALLVVLALTAAPPARAEETPAPAPTAPAPAPLPAPSPSTIPSTTTPSAPPAPTTTAAAVAAPVTYTLGQRTLARGAKGPDVSALQKLLRVKRTGYFNTTTKRAVQKVQRLAGLKANGVVNAKTLKAVKRWARGDLKASRAFPRAGAPAASQRYAAAYIASKYGWGSGQMSCLKVLWTRESGWRYWVSNPNGIYRGIPQTSWRVWGPLGYSTAQYMSSPEIQIKVGTHYIKKRYGNPCNAWAFWRSHHWY